MVTKGRGDLVTDAGIPLTRPVVSLGRQGDLDRSSGCISCWRGILDIAEPESAKARQVLGAADPATMARLGLNPAYWLDLFSDAISTKTLTA